MNLSKPLFKLPRLSTERAFLIFTVFFFCCLVNIYPLDQALSLEWIKHATPLMKWWGRIVHQGVFINGYPGITDITWIVMAWSLHKLYQCKAQETPHKSLQKHLFFLTNSIFLSVGLTRSLKILFARPRPHHWFDHPQSFPTWYELHQDLLPSNQLLSLHGSMPSGHTISMVCLLGLIPLLSKKPALLRALALVFIVIATLSVGYGRVIKRAHWVTDCACSGLFGGFITWAHFKFFGSIKALNYRKYFINITLISIGLMLLGAAASLALRYTHKIY